MCYLLLGEDSEVGHLWWCHASDKIVERLWVIQRLWFSEMICTGSFLTWDFLIPSSPKHPTPAVTWSALCGVVSGATKSKAYLWSHDHSQGFKIVPRFGFADFGGWGVLAGNWRLEILRIDIKNTIWWTSLASQFFFEWWSDQQKLNLSQFFQDLPFFWSLVANSSLVPLYWSLVDFCSGFLQSLLWEACWTRDFMGSSTSLVKPRNPRIDFETSQFNIYLLQVFPKNSIATKIDHLVMLSSS